MDSKKLILTMTVTASAALALVACGGGGGGDTANADGTGSPTVAGTVTGFGSVFVDGVRIDDRGTVAGFEGDDDRVSNTELKLGQSVEIRHDGAFKATQIRVEPEIRGTVSAVNLGAGTLTVLGMTVLVNTSPTAGPVTVFEAPYTLAGVQAGDNIEVHGILKTDNSGKVVLQATRIEKETALGAFKLRGTVSQQSAGTFKLGELTVNYQNARILPTPATVFNGADVIVSLPTSATFAGGTVNATKVVVKNHRDDSRDQEAQLRGVVGSFNIGTRTFTLNGLTVDASQASFSQSGRGFGDLSNGAYVRVKGTFRPDGSVKANSVTLRSVEIDNDGEVELHGSIGDFASNANFTVRGVSIDATGITPRCAAGIALRNDLQIKVEGTLTANGGVRAREIECERDDDGINTVERKGVAGTVDVVAKTFTLAGGTRVQWSDSGTLFVSPLTPATLNGNIVEVEGVLSGNVLTASKIKRDN